MKATIYLFVCFLSPDSLHDPIRNGGNTKVNSFHLKIVETPITVTIVARYTNQ